MDLFINFIFKYGLIAVFLVITIEYACFPISSEIVLPFSGAVASITQISFVKVLIVSVIGGVIGTSFCYFVGRLRGQIIIRKITNKYPKSKKGINSSINNFNKYGRYAVCFGRLIPLIRTYIGFIAGAYNMPYPTFLLTSSIGISIWNTMLIGLGYYLRENWQTVGNLYDNYKSFFIPFFIVLVLLLIIKARRK